LQYGIELEDLILANPSINPNFLSIGITMTIPISNETTTQIPIASLNLELESLDCYTEPLGPAWCLASLVNEHSQSYVNVSVSLSTLNSEESLVERVPASTPVQYFPSGAVMPFGFYFPNGITDDVQYSLNILTGTEISPEIEESIWQEVDFEMQILDQSETSLELNLMSEDLPTTVSQLNLIGYLMDISGKMIGYRVLQIDGGDLAPEFTQSLTINSLGPAIDDYHIYLFVKLSTN
jgi:hypothetical protein